MKGLMREFLTAVGTFVGIISVFVFVFGPTLYALYLLGLSFWILFALNFDQAAKHHEAAQALEQQAWLQRDKLARIAAEIGRLMRERQPDL